MAYWPCPFCALLIASLLLGCAQKPETPVVQREERAVGDVPKRALKVLEYIDKHHAPPEGHEGGREFHNAEQRLPKHDAHGRPIHYQEWDVNPKVPGHSRDAERIVTGSDGSAYFTSDHYQTFIKIR